MGSSLHHAIEGAPHDSQTMFVLDVASALHAYGMPAHRLEALLDALSDRLGMEGSFFCTPTAVFVSFGTAPAQQTFLARSEAGEQDLGKLAELDAVVSQVAAGETTAEQGSAAVRDILARPRRYPRWLTLLCHALVAAPAALLLGGGPDEALVAGGAGLVVGALELMSERSETLSRVLLLAASFVVAALVELVAWVSPGLTVQVATVAGIYMLVPGVSLTTAMNEVATGHLVSGTARFSSAMVAFLSIGLGVAAGGALVSHFAPSASAVTPAAVADYWPFVGLVVALPALLVLLRSRFADGWVVFPVSMIAFAAGHFAAPELGPMGAGMLAALVLGLGSNAYARFRDRPAALVLVPGILLLVPGSMGFRSIASFLRRDTVAAIDTAFTVGLVALALVAGLLVANLLLPPRKAL